MNEEDLACFPAKQVAFFAVNKNKPDTPKAVHDCRELIKWMIPQLDKLPRNRRYTLGEKLENRLLTVLESLVVAAYAPNARTFLFQANRDLEVARHLWRLCYDFRVVSIKSYEHGVRLMLSLGQQVGGWMKVSKR